MTLSSVFLCILQQEEERERRLDFVPEESALQTAQIEVSASHFS